jgi:hypothetical protein
MTKKDQNLDETDREENFVIADEYVPIQGGIKQTNFSHSVRNQELQRIVKILLDHAGMLSAVYN